MGRGLHAAWHLLTSDLKQMDAPLWAGFPVCEPERWKELEPCLTCRTQIHTDVERIGAPGSGVGVASGPLGHTASLDGVVKTKFSGPLKPVLGATAKPTF